MDTKKIIRNCSNNVSSAVYGCLNIEEGNDYNALLESKESNEPASSYIGPLSDFSEIWVQLHIKRGLSKYYKGKSRTFRSLSDCRCLEDLSKKEIHHKKKAYSSFQSPKSSISKKAGRSCFTSLLSKWN